MNKLLVICGGTGVGKTALGIKLAKKFNGEIVSADSRQVYRGMDIGTGKDLPVNSKVKSQKSKLNYYQVQKTRIYCLDIADPKKSFSVSQYAKIAKRVISDIQKRGKLPILVGGTGLYIKAVIEGFDTLDVPKNERLRRLLSRLSVKELYEKICELDAIRGGGMNFSDRQNPRRLMRAIEVAQWQVIHKARKKPKGKFNVLKIGLFSNTAKLKEKIIKRSKLMLKEGVLQEIQKLLDSGVTWKMQSMAAIGYQEWRGFLEAMETREVCFNKWVNNQLSYVGRQNLWFRNDKSINWFDISDRLFAKNVEIVVKKWYSEKDGKED